MSSSIAKKKISEKESGDMKSKENSEAQTKESIGKITELTSLLSIS